MLHAVPRSLGAGLLLFALGGCHHSREAARAPEAPSPPLAQAHPEAVVRNGLTWFHDAPDAAFEHARREQKPVVVDLWASWCHTCLSMQEYVLSETKLPGVGERFVFLAIDTEKPSNAAFLQKLAVSVWPTFYVLGPDQREIRGRWLGAATPAQFMRFLNDGELARAGDASRDAPLAPLRRGDELAAERRFADAAAEYGRALAAAPVDWPRRPEAVVALASAHKQARAFEACAEAYLGAPSLVETAPLSAADLTASALACAAQLPKDDARTGLLRVRARTELERLCTNAHAELTPDDRADACGLWLEISETLKDDAARARAAQTRLAVLEAAARGMPDEVAAIYDFARSDTLVKLGRGEEAIAMLEARGRALPQNYNPPHQLARVFRALKRWDDGLTAIDRALPLAYGPRKLGLLGVKVDLLLGAGKNDAALAVLREQLAGYRALPEGQKRPDAEKAVAERLEGLAATASADAGKAPTPGAKQP